MLKVGCLLIGTLMLALSARELHRAACDQRVSLYAFINSDTLTCAAFYEDIVVDGYPISGFYFPTNTVLFPDCFIYFIARAATGATAPAMILCSCLLFALQMLGCYFIIRVATPKNRRWPQTSILLSLGALFLLVNAHSGLANPFFRLPIVLTYHAGSQVSLLFGMALVLHLLSLREGEGRPRLALVALFINSALGVASDRLLLIHLIAPGAGALLVLRFLAGGAEAGLSLKKVVAIAGVMVSGALSGEQLLRLLQTRWQDVINHYPYTLDHAWHSLALLVKKWKTQLRAGDELHWLATATMIGTLVHLVSQCARRVLRSTAEMTPTEPRLDFLVHLLPRHDGYRCLGRLLFRTHLQPAAHG